MMRFEYDQKFIKLLAKEMVKEMQKVKDEAKEPELITVKEAAETLNLSEDYVRKIPQFGIRKSYKKLVI